MSVGLGQLPSVENLQCFVAAAEHLNFRRAAKTVSLTPTAFGQRIKQLEEQLGTMLFERTTRHVELTPAGHRLLASALDAIEAARQCLDVVHHDEELPARFTIGTRHELGMSWVMPALVALREVRPHWHVDLYFGSGADIVESLRERKVDCIVTSAPVARHDWAAEFLHREEYVFVGAPSLLERVPFRGPHDAQNHTLIDIDESLPLTRYLTSAGPDLRFGDMWCAGAGAPMFDLVKRGFGLAVLPLYMVREEVEAGNLTVLLDDVELLEDSFRLLFRSDSALTEVFADLADFLRERPLT